MKDFAMFWGCTIPARFPFLEKSVRVTLDKLGVPFRDLEGFTCCPEKSLVNNVDNGMWTLTAARNVALADEAGVDVVSPCTGCVSNLATVKSELDSNPGRKDEVNKLLKGINREFTGEASLKHLVPYLHDEVGLLRIRNAAIKPMKGMRIAVHYGCHMMRPSHALSSDDPLNPKKFDALIRALGAESMGYLQKLTCCGQGLDRVDQHDRALDLARVKLRELRSLGADAMALCCPSCFLQFDNNQFLMEREGEKYALPVFYITDLMGLTMGLSPEDLALASHRVATAPFIEKWEAALERPSPSETIKDGIASPGAFL